ncbi:olfactory receptor 1-like [Megalops cyprinoides]|uniref:olfactory receptor 1-like n=1 Tax=Megalops cyprinoides TaxID=118141 RepID=UPI001863C619|nr:olfactory receptor 1-like [Megalops cyprinoides]
MENSSQVTFFILSAYDKIGQIKYFYFSIVMLLYVFIIVANSLLIIVIFADRNLHEPMYLFLCNLSVNGLYGSTALYPSLLVNMLSDIHEIPRAFCIIQIFCLYTYGSIEFSNLALMSYDRYVSICYPLEYHTIMTQGNVYICITCVWLFSICKFTVTLILSVRLKLCDNVIDKVYCDNYLMVKLACSDTTLNNAYGMTNMFVSVALPVVLIFYSYSKVMKICLRSSRESQIKALNTCMPHLVSLLNFSFGSFFELVQTRFDMTHVPSVVRSILSVYFILFPPLLNPIIYGIKTEKIRKAFKKLQLSLQIPVAFRKSKETLDSVTQVSHKAES